MHGPVNGCLILIHQSVTLSVFHINILHLNVPSFLSMIQEYILIVHSDYTQFVLFPADSPEEAIESKTSNVHP